MKKHLSTPLTRFFLKALKPILPFIILIFAAAYTNNGDEKSEYNKNLPEQQPGKGELVTVAGMNESRDGKTTELRFYEHAAIFNLDKNDKIFLENSSMLKDALRSNIPVKLEINPKTNAIARLSKATEAEVKFYNEGEGPNSLRIKIKSEPPAMVDLLKIDTAKFNFVENQLRFPAFKLCTNVVPDYTTLVAIFNYCASQGCNNPPPYSITNCIPFQYVIDGCYARAHKMRQMISKKYGYCVEKVFSFAQPYPNTLAVKADKWGGCCVTWWYHVAPLLRLNVKRGTITRQLCYVIDPGMFNAPVTLSTWLNAQKNTTCSANATVTSYSIQPGSAYWPMGGGTYGTDNAYTSTEQTLINYKNRVTCH